MSNNHPVRGGKVALGKKVWVALTYVEATQALAKLRPHHRDKYIRSTIDKIKDSIDDLKTRVIED